MGSLVRSLGEVSLDIRSAFALDSLGNLTSFTTKVKLNNLPMVMRVQGKVDGSELKLTVQSGDVVTVTNKPQEFYYIGGRINYPGQKVFQPGITLLQAILAAGGTSQKENRVEISRAGADGRLATVLYRIKEIKAGTVEDPKLQPGDRIEVAR